jgi:two-component system LytT family response regulator
MSSAEDLSLENVEQLRRAPAVAFRKLEGAAIAARIRLRCGPRTFFIAPERIDWIEAAGNYSSVHMDGCALLVREQIGDLAAALPWPILRIHRSVIVNVDRVLEIRRTGRRKWAAVLSNGTILPLADESREPLERHLMQG